MPPLQLPPLQFTIHTALIALLLATTPHPYVRKTAVHTMVSVLCTTQVIVKTDTVNMPIHIHLESSNTALVGKYLMNKQSYAS